INQLPVAPQGMVARNRFRFPRTALQPARKEIDSDPNSYYPSPSQEGCRVETPFYDALETRDRAEREASLMAALPGLIAAAKERAPAYRRLFAALRPEDVIDRRALAQLPLTRKSDLIELQRQKPPFGGFAAVPVSALRRVFVSPGPIYEPEGRRPDFGRFARALFAAGFRSGDLVHNTFSYHMTPAAPMTATC